MIECRNIQLSFKNKQIFKGLNLEIREGEFICIGGESGRGKSTLLKMLQGYIKPDSGEIYVNGELMGVKTLAQTRQLITWIPQNINLPVNNGIELLELLTGNTSQKAVIDYLISLGLDESFLHKEFTKISGGQKQRVIIAVCLSLNKPIIIMDEPTSSLDEKSIIKLIETIKALKGKTIISASHNLTWMNYCDRVVEL